MVAEHLRRLEAVRRAGIVERMAEGVWSVPDGLAERGRQYDAQRVVGTYRRSIMLASGRHAMLDNGMGFNLISGGQQSSGGRAANRRDDARWRSVLGDRPAARSGRRLSYCASSTLAPTRCLDHQCKRR